MYEKYIMFSEIYNSLKSASLNQDEIDKLSNLIKTKLFNFVPPIEERINEDSVIPVIRIKSVLGTDKDHQKLASTTDRRSGKFSITKQMVFNESALTHGSVFYPVGHPMTKVNIGDMICLANLSLAAWIYQTMMSMVDGDLSRVVENLFFLEELNNCDIRVITAPIVGDPNLRVMMYRPQAPNGFNDFVVHKHPIFISYIRETEDGKTGEYLKIEYHRDREYIPVADSSVPGFTGGYYRQSVNADASWIIKCFDLASFANEADFGLEGYCH